MPKPLLVHYRERDSVQPDCRYPYEWRFIGSNSIDIALMKACAAKQAQFVIGGWSSPVYLQTMALARGRYSIWTDVPRPGHRSVAKDYIRNCVLRFAFSGARHVIVTGQPGISMLERLGTPRAKLVNFPYWVDVPDTLQSKPETHEPLRILAIGRLVPIKNFVHLIHLAQKLRELKVRFSITIIGEGPDRERIEAARDAAGLTTFIQLPG